MTLSMSPLKTTHTMIECISAINHIRRRTQYCIIASESLRANRIREVMES